MTSSLQQQAENNPRKSPTHQKHKTESCGWLCTPVPCWTIIVMVVITALVSTVTYSLIRCHSGELPVPSRSAPAREPAQCPEEMIRIHKMCYFLSERRMSWAQSEEICSKYGGSLLIMRQNTENDLKKLNVNDDFWIGLKKEGNTWKWVDGAEYNKTIHNDSRLNCAYLNGKIMVLACDTPRRFICSKSIGGDV